MFTFRSIDLICLHCHCLSTFKYHFYVISTGAFYELVTVCISARCNSCKYQLWVCFRFLSLISGQHSTQRCQCYASLHTSSSTCLSMCITAYRFKYVYVVLLCTRANMLMLDVTAYQCKNIDVTHNCISTVLHHQSVHRIIARRSVISGNSNILKLA